MEDRRVWVLIGCCLVLLSIIWSRGANQHQVRFDCANPGLGAAAETSSNELTTENDFSSVQVVSVPAGRTLTAYLDAYASRTGGTSVTNNYRLANTSLAAIKR